MKKMLMLCMTLLVGGCSHGSGKSTSTGSATTNVNPPKESAVTLPAGAPLTATELQTLITLNKTRGLDQEVFPDFAAAMGMTKGNTGVPVRQLAVVMGNNTDAVSFGTFKKERTGYLFVGRNAKGSYAFYVDENLNLLAAAKRSPSNTPATTLPLADAKQDFRDVLSIWARLADSPPTETQTN